MSPDLPDRSVTDHSAPASPLGTPPNDETVAVFDRRSAISATISCTKCGGSGEPSKRRHGYPDERCSRCRGSGAIERGHYAYCKRAECVGCRPSLAEIETMQILDLWGEMMARCVAQTPETKSRGGAIAALRADDSGYSSVAYFARRYNLLVVAVEDAERAILGSGTNEADQRLHEALRLLWDAAGIASASPTPTLKELE